MIGMGKRTVLAIIGWELGGYLFSVGRLGMNGDSSHLQKKVEEVVP